ncbi:MAG: exosortase system-associated protein, TIGR04073 family [Candidatus Omnitrophica bacterium]|nr:exosortase system-associated protein, TIGR04073 family [Candidatus Omnitrophota bacterium]
MGQAKMRKKCLPGSVAALVGLFLLMGTTACFAQDALTKLGRGVANTLTGWVELPKNIYSTSRESNALTGMTLGVAKGAGMTIVRTGAGIYEIATFPFPLPEDYKPILEPEYVF